MIDNDDAMFYKSIHEIWEELEATLEDMKVKTEEAENLLTFLKSYVELLHEYSNMIEGLRYGIKTLLEGSEHEHS